VPHILILCQANTARSIMAQVMLERMLAGRPGEVPVRVVSGGVGLYARDGMLPSLDARIVLREIGIHLAEDTLTSTDLRQHPELVAGAAVILTMTAAQREAVRGFAGLDGQPVLTLRELAGEHGDIADPAAQGEDAFRAARDEIRRCLALGFDRLLQLLPPAPTR
jgi:protein-tyrosine phosphatase